MLDPDDVPLKMDRVTGEKTAYLEKLSMAAGAGLRLEGGELLLPQ